MFYQIYQKTIVIEVLPQRDLEDLPHVTAKHRRLLPNGSMKKPSQSGPISLLVAGILVALGGVFLTLAAHQVLPQGMNAISQLGVGGQVIGYGVLGLGSIVVLVGMVKLHAAKKHITTIDEINAIYLQRSDRAIDSFVRSTLGCGEFFAIDDKENKKLIIYCAARADISCDQCTYTDNAYDRLLMWAEDEKEIDLSKMRNVTLNELQQRIKPQRD